MNVNCFMGVGRIGSVPYFTDYPGSGKSKVTGILIINSFNNRKDIIPFVAWDERARRINEFCSKGKEVWIRGPIRTRPVKNKDGTSYTGFEIEIHEISFGEDGDTTAGSGIFLRKKKQ